MFEDSPEAFVQRWRPYAAQVELFAHTEGSPLLELATDHAVLQVLERTGPYLATPGPATAILNPTTDRLGADAAPGKELEASGVASLRARGLVLLRDDPFVVVDAGVPLVVGVEGDLPEVGPGDWVEFESRAPVHGFLIPPSKRPVARSEERNGV